MLILYHKKTGEILGVSMVISDSSASIPQPTLENVNVQMKNLEGYVLPDDEDVLRDLPRYKLEFDADGRPMGFIKKEVLRIDLSTDAPDTNGDGVPEIPAGGGKCTIIASVRNEFGKVVKDRPLRIQFITSGGILRTPFADTHTGVAKVNLESMPETKRVRVEARAEGCTPGSMEVDFIYAPPG